jgi:Ca2+-binding RTX toxin-like protein
MAGLAVLPATASAAPTCSLAAGLVAVNNPSGIADVTIRVDGTAIKVFDDGVEVPCAGAPTTANTNTVTYTNTNGISDVAIVEPDAFQPGLAPEANGSEIEFILTEVSGILSDVTLVDGDGNADSIVAGDGGGAAFNFNPAETTDDADMTGIGFSTRFAYRGGAGADIFNGAGGQGTGAAFPVSLDLEGGGNNDALTGGTDFDDIVGGEGNDTLVGGLSSDDFIGDPGDDFIDGGPADFDFIDYSESTAPASIDLLQAPSIPQAAGSFGRDRIVGVEELTATPFNDVVRGTNGDDDLRGGGGDDLMEGRGGDDDFDGGGGIDTLSYEGAPAGIAFDLQSETTQNTAGAGEDESDDGSMENFRGSRFADNVKGTPGANVIDPGAGADTVDARGGDDTVLARDGARDNVNCGAGTDRGVFDPPGADIVTACESADFLDIVVRLLAGGAKKQKIKRNGVAVSLRCPDEACSVSVSARAKIAGRRKTLKLSSAKTSLARNRAKSIRLKLGRRDRARVRAALRARKRVTVTFTATARDALGNRTTVKRSVRLRR